MSDEEVLLKPFARGHRRFNLLRACAEQKGTWKEIAQRFGITENGLWKWRQANAAAIAEIQADVENQMSGLWIANKRNRVAEYQSDAELVDEMIADGAEQPQVLLKVKHGAMRSVAEELGHLSPKDTSDATRVDVRIIGVDGDAL